MNKNKQTLKQTFEVALKNYKNRDFKTAEIFCNKILSIDPNHLDSISLLANVSALNRDYKKAKNLLHKAIEIQPNNLTVLNNLGTTYKELGDSKKAINYYEKILQIDSNHTNANYNLGLVFYKLKDLKKAKSYLLKTVEIQKNYAIAFFGLANVYVDLKDLYNAISCYQKAIKINPNLIGAHNNLGLVYRKLNDFKNAVSCYKKVIKIEPKHTGTHHNLALAYKEIGEFQKAIQSHQMAAKYEPNNSLHYYYLSELKKGILNFDLKNKIKKISQNKNSTKMNVAYAKYLLSKYERKSKNYEQEFNYLIEGHKFYFDSKEEKFKLGVKYCFDDVLQIVKGANVSKLYHRDDYKLKPIFIVGVPRCGSTLIEKIIASGKKLIPMGEETAVFENFVNDKILQKKSLDLGDVIDIRKELYDIYKEKGLISKKSGNTFTDKSLNNFFYLNLMKDIYPNAKIINCKRDILSSIISIFQNNLTELAWTHNLENIFEYFNNYFEIIKNFKESYPDYIYELQFEDFTSNPMESSKKMMEFLELPWDKKCLEFYKRKDLILKTASNVQVRKAIYKHSLDKYLPYKKYLKQYGTKYSWFK